MKSQDDQESGLIPLIVDRPVAVTMVVLAVAVFGWVSFQKLSLTLLPKISYPSLTVRTEYPGSAPAEVEELVTKPLESNLAVISNLNGFRSISRAGVSDLILEFEWDTNMNFAAQDVREKVDQVRSFLPQDVKKPLLLKYDPTLDPIMRLGLFGDLELERIRFYGEEKLKKQLESIPGVAAIKVRGGFESEIRIDISEESLQRNNITIDVIQQRLSEENINLASGLLREGDTEYLVRTLNEFESIQEIADLVVDSRNGTFIRLKDVAHVHRANKEPDVITRIEGRPSVEIAIFKEDAANIVNVSKLVKTKLFGEGFESRLKDGIVVARSDEDQDDDALKTLKAARPMAEMLPAGVELRILSDQSRFIESSISEVQNSGIIGAIVAILVLLVFLKRLVSTVVIAIAIPISVIATFGPMMHFDVSLNIMSLGGLALGIGMLVDASIVVLESIDRCRQDGDSLRQAAIRGTREVGGAVVASVLTTIAVFLPIVFVEGIAGEIFKDQSLTVVFSLLASLAVALFFIPMLAARPFADEQKQAPRGLREYFGDIWVLLRDRCFKQWPLVTNAWRFIKNRQSTLSRGLAIIFVGPTLPFNATLDFALKIPYVALVIILLLIKISIGVPMMILKYPALVFSKIFDAAYSLVESTYQLTLKVALKQRALVLIAAVALMVFSWQLLDQVGVDLIPEMHSGEIIIESQKPIGTALDSNGRLTLELEKKLMGMRDAGEFVGRGVSSSMGVARDEIAPAGDGPHTAKIYLKLPVGPNMAAKEAEVVDILRDGLTDQIGGGELSFSTPKLFTFKNPLEVQVLGDDLVKIEKVAKEIERRMKNMGELTDVRSSAEQGSPEFVIKYDRIKLADRNLKLSQAASVLRDKIKGVIPTRYSETSEGRKIDVLVKIPDENVTSVRALQDIEIAKVDGRSVRLGEVASVKQGRGPSEVRRVAGQRSIIITAVPNEVDLKTAAALIETQTEEMRAKSPGDFRGVVVKVAGQSQEAERSSEELIFALILALILVYIVMASQFESLLDPLVIMVSSLFAGVGAIFALILLDISASVVVFIGIIMLAGIVVNNAIVLIDSINRLQREHGLSRHDAILKGGMLRLRPILMTTLTTVLGLLPMALSTGEGAEMRMPMAVTVIAGLSFSTILTLIIIPVVYSAAHAGTEMAGNLTGARR
ncbi:MAG: HAE1 family hydrophobic/amphiphilic exporter-1 [Planctomycetota bacterium]|jgi:HAE1 family hydrophobic/amphiphilic exporter-1